MKKNSKKVLNAVETIGNYCSERGCSDCMFCRTNGCLLRLRDPEDYYELAENLKKLLEPEE